MKQDEQDTQDKILLKAVFILSILFTLFEFFSEIISLV